MSNPIIKPAEAPRILPRTGWAATLTTLVAAAMAFLAVLTLAASMAASRLAAEWRTDLTGVATVRVSAPTDQIEENVKSVLEILRTTPGIREVKVLSDDEQAALLAPWLGAGTDLADLPAPRLIDIALDGDGPDAKALRERLNLTVSGVEYDDHAAWRAPLASAARALERLALGATVLVLMTAGIMVAFAARATLAANTDVIATVRLMGGEEAFIAGAFVRSLVSRAVIGAFAGTLVAAAALMALPSVDADPALAAALAPDRMGWLWLVLGLPLASGLVAWLAARTAVRMALSRLP